MEHTGTWTFLADEAVAEEQQDAFRVHSIYAKLLLSIARSCVTPFTIGLYSGWGTGKTTISRILESLIKDDKTLYYVYLDVWKYSSDPLKRWILLETHRQLEEAGAIQGYRFNDRDLRSHLEYEEHWEQKEGFKIDLSALRRIASISGLALVSAVLLFLVVYLFVPTASKFYGTLSAITGAIVGGSISTFLYETVVKKMLEPLSKMVFKQETRHISSKPAFSSETFAAIFSDLIRCATRSSRRAIFIFDNLDRCPEQVAVEALSVIKTYLGEKNCIYVLPCDENALVRHLQKSYTSDIGETAAKRYAKDFLDKFFQVTLRLPSTEENDFEQFLDTQLTIAGMQDLPVDAREVLALGYQGKTPRQIKRVLNDLIAYRELATFAEQGGLVESGALTGDLALLTKMSVLSVQWPELLDKLAEDPERWAEVQIAVRERRTPNFFAWQADLASFLFATRLVGPENDIRQFLYLKRVEYEKNLALARQLEVFLKRGDLRGYEEALKLESSPQQQDVVSATSVALARKWLRANRNIFVQNCGRLLVHAAVALPASRSLQQVALDVVERVAELQKPEELIGLFDIEDLLKLDPNSTSPQKQTALKSLITVFAPAFPAGPIAAQVREALLSAHLSLTSEMKNQIGGFLHAAYVQDAKKEAEIQALAERAAKSRNDLGWLVNSGLLSAMAQKVTLEGGEPDNGRLTTLAAFQGKLPTPAKERLLTVMTAAVSGTRTRVADVPVKCVADYLMQVIKPTAFAEQDLKPLLSSLLEQVDAHPNIAEKGIWVKPLFAYFDSLSKDQQEKFLGLFSSALGDPADPESLLKLLQQLGAAKCTQLLSHDGIKSALRKQPAALLTRFAGSKEDYRSRILSCFTQDVILASQDLFDDSQVWDLTVYLKLLRSAREASGEPDNLRQRFTEFCTRFLSTDSPTLTTPLRDAVSLATEKADLVSTEAWEALAAALVRLLGSDLSLYSLLQGVLKMLSPETKAREIESILETHVRSRTRIWTEALSKVTEDTLLAPDLLARTDLTGELLAFGFEAAKEKPALIFGPMFELLQRADETTRGEYQEKALDYLVSQEGSGVTGEREGSGVTGESMSPFIQIAETSGVTLSEWSLQQAKRFCHRMFAATKDDKEKARALVLLQRLGNPDLVNGLSKELTDLASDDNLELNSIATSLLGHTPEESQEEPKVSN